MIPGAEYQAVTLGLGRGDVVTVFTDGVTDAMAPDGRMFGQEGVDRCLRPGDDPLADGCRPRHVGERLVQAVTRHAAGRDQNDDIAVVCFGRLEAGHGPGTGPTRIHRANR